MQAFFTPVNQTHCHLWIPKICHGQKPSGTEQKNVVRQPSVPEEDPRPGPSRKIPARQKKTPEDSPLARIQKPAKRFIWFVLVDHSTRENVFPYATWYTVLLALDAPVGIGIKKA
jgi:hypothetical protein